MSEGASELAERREGVLGVYRRSQELGERRIGFIREGLARQLRECSGELNPSERGGRLRMIGRGPTGQWRRR